MQLAESDSGLCLPRILLGCFPVVICVLILVCVVLLVTTLVVVALIVLVSIRLSILTKACPHPDAQAHTQSKRDKEGREPRAHTGHRSRDNESEG